MSERDADMGVGSVAHGRTYTAEEVARLASNGADLLICDGRVVDFSAFTHPGGRSVLTRHAGEDVSDMFRGIAGTRSSSHKPMAHMRSDAHAHSAAAFSMLTRLAVGTIDATAASETGAESDGPFARVTERRNSRNKVESYRVLSGDCGSTWSSARIPFELRTSRFLG